MLLKSKKKRRENMNFNKKPRSSMILLNRIYITFAGWPLVLESPGVDFSPGKASWKTDFSEKSPGKVLEKIIC